MARKVPPTTSSGSSVPDAAGSPATATRVGAPHYDAEQNSKERYAVAKAGSEEWWMEKIKEQRSESFRLGFQAGFALSALIFGVLFNWDKFQ